MTDAPPAMFTPDDDVATLWLRSYQGEVIGEILFGRIADQRADPEQARKMRMLTKLERRTKEAMIPAMERAGVPTEPDAETVGTAEALAEGSVDVPWDNLMASFEPITTQYAAMYARIGGSIPSELATSDLLVAHEMALRDFGRLELSGSPETSLVAIEALPHLQ